MTPQTTLYVGPAENYLVSGEISLILRHHGRARKALHVLWICVTVAWEADASDKPHYCYVKYIIIIIIYKTDPLACSFLQEFISPSRLCSFYIYSPFRFVI